MGRDWRGADRTEPPPDPMHIRVAEILGLPVDEVECHHCQDGLNFQRGYAFAVPGYGTVKYRKEGVGRMSGRKVRTFAPGDYTVEEQQARFIAEVLRTGRTSECGVGVDLASFDKWPIGQRLDTPFSAVMRYVLGKEPDEFDSTGDEPWNLSPDYQRGHVWTEQQSRLFLGHVLSGGNTPPLWVNRFSDFRIPEEVIDGQQRCRAILAFAKGDLSAEMHDGTGLWYKDFNERDHRHLNCFIMPVVFVKLSRQQRIDLYLRLAAGGIGHTPEEIYKAKMLLSATRPEDV